MHAITSTPVNQTIWAMAGAKSENRVCAVTNPVGRIELRMKQLEYPGQINAAILGVGVISVNQDTN